MNSLFSFHLRAKFFQFLHKPRMLRNIFKNQNGKIAKDTRQSSTTTFVNKQNITIGNNVYIGHYTILDGTGGLEIGDGCQIAARASILTHSTHISIRILGNMPLYTRIQKDYGYKSGKVKIGSFTFVGTGAIITSGVTIGKGCIVGANSFVNSDMPDYSIAYGSPAKIAGDTRSIDSVYLEGNQEFQECYNEWQSK